MKSIYILFLLILTFSSCEKFSESLILGYNNSSKNIYIILGLGLENEFYPLPLYPDTILPLNNPLKTYNKVIVNDTITVQYSRFSTKELYNFFSSVDTLSFFIFNADTVDFQGWDIVRDEYKILARYDLSYNNVKSLNYRIPYPPTSKMHNMKMYIP